MRGVISIGAHYGEEYEGWLSLGVKNFMFFEPVNANFTKLAKILPLGPNIVLHKMALGNMTGRIFMHIEEEHNGKSCSILKPFLHLEQYPDIKFTHRELVHIDKLDNIDYDRSLYDHLHIDTQGYELEVLKGAEHSLRHIETIEVEVYREELYERCAMAEQVTMHLEARGFEFVSVYWRGNTWGDAKFERSC